MPKEHKNHKHSDSCGCANSSATTTVVGDTSTVEATTVGETCSTAPARKPLVDLQVTIKAENLRALEQFVDPEKMDLTNPEQVGELLNNFTLDIADQFKMQMELIQRQQAEQLRAAMLSGKPLSGAPVGAGAGATIVGLDGKTLVP